MKAYANGADIWNPLYAYGALVFDYLTTKTKIAELLVPSYKAGDKATLASIKDELLPKLREQTIALHKAHKAWWMSYNKPFGWNVLDIRYGGMASRCDCAIEQLDEYLSGKVSALLELEEPRLYKSNTSMNRFARTFTVMQTI
jgi:hypothetical protein